jgi:hypothetical protein
MELPFGISVWNCKKCKQKWIFQKWVPVAILKNTYFKPVRFKELGILLSMPCLCEGNTIDPVDWIGKSRLQLTMTDLLQTGATIEATKY